MTLYIDLSERQKTLQQPEQKEAILGQKIIFKVQYKNFGKLTVRWVLNIDDVTANKGASSFYKKYIAQIDSGKYFRKFENATVQEELNSHKEDVKSTEPDVKEKNGSKKLVYEPRTESKLRMLQQGDYFIGRISHIRDRIHTVEATSAEEGLFLKLCPSECSYMVLSRNALKCPNCNSIYKYRTSEISTWYGQELY